MMPFNCNKSAVNIRFSSPYRRNPYNKLLFYSNNRRFYSATPDLSPTALKLAPRSSYTARLRTKHSPFARYNYPLTRYSSSLTR